MTSAIGTMEQLDQREGTPERILPRLVRLLDARPQSELLTLGIAQRMGIEGDRAGATEFLRERAQINPGSVAISRTLVSALMVQKDFDAAANEAERLSNIAPEDLSTLVFTVNALIDANAANRAVPIAERVRTLSPNSPRGATLLAEAQVKSGAVDDARRTLRAAQKTWPDAVSIVAARVRLEVAERNPDTVKAVTKKLSRKNPSAAARLTATALAEMGQPGIAVEVLERAFKARPDSRLAVDLFSARRRAGRDEIAFEDLSRWVEANRDDRAALMSYATGLLEVGRHGESAKAYEAYLAMVPNNPVALNNYAWLRHQSQRPDALDYAQRAYNAASGSPEIADTYGWMLVTYGKLKEGLALLQTAQAAAPNSPGIHYHFAYALSKAGRKDEAKKVLVNVLQGTATFDERADAEQLMQNLGG
jgi:predicted Zn-dependent protease